MRYAFGVVLVLLVCSCAGQPENTQCAEPRPQVCTMEYAPTCAVLGESERKEYSSPCNACADDTVHGYVAGACPE
jgi:hypothetical protein